MKPIRILAGGLVLVGTVLYCIFATDDVYTKLLIVVGGVGLGLAVLRFEGRRIRLPLWFQLLLGVSTILAAILATNWTTFCSLDLSNWFVASMIALVYKDGFLWTWSHLIRKEMSHP